MRTFASGSRSLFRHPRQFSFQDDIKIQAPINKPFRTTITPKPRSQHNKNEPHADQRARTDCWDRSIVFQPHRCVSKLHEERTPAYGPPLSWLLFGFTAANEKTHIPSKVSIRKDNGERRQEATANSSSWTQSAVADDFHFPSFDFPRIRTTAMRSSSTRAPAISATLMRHTRSLIKHTVLII